MPDLNYFIDQVKELPPAPRILPELLTLLGRDDLDVSRVIDLVRFDPALTAKVLQGANNAFQGSVQPVRHLEEAAVRIGLGEIYRLVTAALLEGTLRVPQPGYGMARGELWEHSVATAMAGRVVAREQSLDDQVVFTAALLHDIGKLVLSAALESAYEAILRETGPSHKSFLEAEKAILGVDHAEVGGKLLERWRFPECLVRAIWHHHDPTAAAPHQQLAACVNLADIIAHFLGRSYGYQAYAVRVRPEVIEILGITPAKVEKLVLDTQLELQASRILSAA